MRTQSSIVPARWIPFVTGYSIFLLCQFGTPAPSLAQGEIRGFGNGFVVPGAEALSGLSAVSAGEYHNLALKTSGSVIAWGWNISGACAPPDPNADFIAVTTTLGTSFGLKTDGSIVVWGEAAGWLGQVPEPNAGFLAVDGGQDHVLALRSDGSIAAWGYDPYGQCDVPQPNGGFVAIAAGRDHSLGLKSDGSVVAWGRNHVGQCAPPSPTGYVALATGWDHSLALRSDGSIIAWGDNGEGQCSVPSPNAGFIAVAAGAAHSLGLKADGTVVAWGANGSGQCDVLASEQRVVQISAADDYSIALLEDGTLLEWGCQSGNCHRGASSTYTGFVDLAVGSQALLARRGDGSVAAWGFDFPAVCAPPEPNRGFLDVAAGEADCVDWDCWVNYAGVRSDGSLAVWGSWDSTMVPAPNEDFTSVAVGCWHALGLKRDGSVVAWGWNGSGECDVPEPNAGFVQVDADSWRSAALRSDGSIVVWGGGTVWSPEPNAGFTAVSISDRHVLALREDGSIMAWGSNDNGESNVPLPNEDFVAMGAGGTGLGGFPGAGWSFGVKENGAIVAWGAYVEVPVPNEGFVSVVSGGFGSYALYDPAGMIAGVENPPGPSGGTRAPQPIQLDAVPNPFSPSTVLRYRLEAPADLRFRVHDVQGRCVREFMLSRQPAGWSSVRWDGRDDQGRNVPAGVYFARVTDGRSEASCRVTLVR